MDHLAIRCEKLVSFQYKKRHDAVVKAIDLHIAKKHGLTKDNKIGLYNMQPMMKNRNAEIKFDIQIITAGKSISMTK